MATDTTNIHNNPTSGALLTQLDKILFQLLTKMESIVALAPTGTPSTPPTRTTTAIESYQIEVETAALVRSAQEILVLTRSLKEAWLFGPLDTLEKKEKGGSGGVVGEVVRGLKVKVGGLVGGGVEELEGGDKEEGDE